MVQPVLPALPLLPKVAKAKPAPILPERKLETPASPHHEASLEGNAVDDENSVVAEENSSVQGTSNPSTAQPEAQTFSEPQECMCTKFNAYIC